MRGTRYRFRSTWRVQAPTGEVFEILRDLAGYPRWWRQVRSVERTDDDAARLHIRSALPYTLRLTLQRRVEDPAAGILEVQIAGDLEGSARWRLHPEPSGTRLEYEQDVRTRHRLMNLLTPIARRAFVANHRAMMRGGEAGLRRLFEVRRRRAGSDG